MVLLNEAAALKEQGKKEVEIEVEQEPVSAETKLERFLLHGRLDVYTDLPVGKIPDPSLMKREDLTALRMVISRISLIDLFDSLAAMDRTATRPLQENVIFVLSQTAKLYKNRTLKLALTMLKSQEEFILFVKYSAETRPFIIDEVLIDFVKTWCENCGALDTKMIVRGWSIDGIKKMLESSPEPES